MKDFVGKLVRQKRPLGKNGVCRDTAKIMIVKDGVKRIFSLGRWGSPEAERAYKQLMVQYYSNTLQLASKDSVMADCLMDYMNNATILKSDKSKYRTKRVLKWCLDLCGTMQCSSFSFSTITLIKERIIKEAKERNWTKSYTNQFMSVLKHILTYGVIKGWLESSLLPIIKIYPPIAEDLKPLKKRVDVPDDVVEATIKYMKQPYIDIIRLIRSACLRPVELFRIRKSDIEVKDNCWVVRVKSKTERYGYDRILVFNKKEQEILKKWIKDDDEILFYSDRGKPCTTTQLEQAIRIALKEAEKHGENIPKWTAYQLRHTAFTENVKKFGIEIAAKLAGHSSIDMAKIYDHSTLDILIDIAQKRCNNS